MKLRALCEDTHKVRVAHVGASVDPDNPEPEIWGENDQWHVDAAFKWLDNNTEDAEWLFYRNRRDDYIDLNDGRDFLQERSNYDIVILHMVYSPDELDYRGKEGSIFNISPLHNPRNWRNRLVSTGAKYIFAFGDTNEVSGRYLGRLPGYVGPIDAGNYLTVYTKE